MDRPKMDAAPGDGAAAGRADIPDPYGILRAVLPQLEADPNNANLALAACQSYISLGLIGPAREMLADGGGPLARMAEFRLLAGQLGQIPGGQVPWTSLRARFEKNRRRVLARHPGLRAFEPDFDSVRDRFELFRSRDGGLHMSTRICGVRRWVPDFLDARAFVSAFQMPHDSRAMFCGSYVIAGDRFGLLFERVCEATKSFFMTFRPRLYVLEPEPDMLGIWLHTAESVECLCEDRVSLFVGPECVKGLEAHLRRRPREVIPSYAVGIPATGRRIPVEAADMLRSLVAERGREADIHLASATSRYAVRDSRYWLERYRERGVKPLRVMGLTSRFTTVLQYAMRDLKAAFEARGHEFRLLIEEDDYELWSPANTVESIDAYRPDLFFVIDHFRREYGCAVPAGLPYVGWIQDHLPHLVSADMGRSLGPLDFFIAAELDQFTRMYAYPASQGMAWTTATNEQTYRDEPMPESALAPHRCDFSFVSNQSQLPSEFHAEWRSKLGADAGARRLIDHAYEILCRDMKQRPRVARGRPAMHVLEQVARETGIRPATAEVEDSIARFYIHPLSELLFRQQALEWAADFCDRTGRRLNLYGRGWEKHPRFARYTRGIAANGAELRAIYQASAINLQIIGTGAVHPRLLDGVAAGGFFLIRYTTFDVLHEHVRRLLNAFDREGIEPDREYDANERPEFARAIRELVAFETGCDAAIPVRVDSVHLARYRSMAGCDYRLHAGAVFADYGRVCFDSRDSFASLADEYLQNAELRRSLARSMRQPVLERFTYGALVDRLLVFMESRFEAQAAGST